MHSILSPYPAELVRIYAGPDPSRDLGEFLPHLGKVQRFFKPKDPNYDDEVVRAFINQRGDDPKYYDDYVVVPKDISLAYKSVIRYNKPAKPVSDEIEQLYVTAFKWIDAEYSLLLGGSRVLEWSEVLEYMPTGKSPGYPFTLKYQFKEDFYGSEVGESHLSDYWEKLETEDYYRSLCACSIKEEIRGRAKVYDLGKARTIVPMPCDHVMSHARLCLDQNRKIVHTVGQAFSALGTNFLYGGAHALIDRHQTFAGGAHKKCSMAFDGVQFDGRFFAKCMQEIGKLRFGWLAPRFRTPENQTRLRNLYHELANAPLVMPDGHVFGRGTGNPSGQFCTTPDNGFKNECDFFVMWMLLAPPDMCNWPSFKANVLISTTGDDINVTVKEDLHPLFNPAAIMKAAEAISMEYTCEFDDFVEFHKLSFLGHNFRLVDLPDLGHAMFLPIIECKKMRTNMLIYNSKRTVANTITRACGLRNETFACDECRLWFSELIFFLRDKYHASLDPEIIQAWSNYKSDSELWSLYSGMDAERVWNSSEHGAHSA